MTVKKAALGALCFTVLCMAALYVVYKNRILVPENRTVVLGFDGVDPRLSESWMERGLLPNLKKLKDEGTFSVLETTYPAESPVAWSSFLTGSNPGKTNIFDFLIRDPETYMPDLALVELQQGRFLWDAIPVKRPRIVNRRKGKAFWEIASEWHIPTGVLRAPISFPAQEFGGGHLLCGLGVPDLRGTWGTFSFYSSLERSRQDTEMGGKIVPVLADGGEIQTSVIGPPNRILLNRQKEIRKKIKKGTTVSEKEKKILERDDLDLTLPLTFKIQGPDRVEILTAGQSQTVEAGNWSEWFDLSFKVTPVIRVHGIARFYVKSVQPEFEAYLSPINFHPAKPPFPIGAPGSFSKRLFEKHGRFKTLGWETDTWALNENRLDEAVFLEDLHFGMNQNRDMLLRQLDDGRDWLTVALFHETDRVQHMFWRLLDEKHPMYDPELARSFGNSVLEVYQKMDEIVGDVRARLPEKAALIVVSDHGFHSFRYAVNLNTWLVQNGFMKLAGEEESRDRRLDDLFGDEGSFWENVDWSSTQAYSIGLGGVYLNLKGREARGIVSPGREAERVLSRLIEGLNGMRDPYTGEIIMNRAVLTRDHYHGDYAGNAPDIEVGFKDGYRVSWQSTLGQISKRLVEPNMRKWSGDHCSFDARELGGVLFSNRKLRTDRASIMDIAPTVLELLEVEAPDDMDGVSLLSSSKPEPASP